MSLFSSFDASVNLAVFFTMNVNSLKLKNIFFHILTKVLVDQWSQNLELERKCQQFFAKVEILARRNFDVDSSTGFSDKCR
jgi:hypothetical protein